MKYCIDLGGDYSFTSRFDFMVYFHLISEVMFTLILKIFHATDKTVRNNVVVPQLGIIRESINARLQFCH